MLAVDIMLVADISIMIVEHTGIHSLLVEIAFY